MAKRYVELIDAAGGMGADAVELVAEAMLKIYREAKVEESDEN